MEIRPLGPQDDRERFESGDPDLDRFFRKFAGQNQFRYQIGTTYVALEDGAIVGFATVASGHIEVEDLPETLAKRFPRYPLPILRLARLAVAKLSAGRGVGGSLLYAVFEIALAQSASVGCVGVVVDAKPKAAEWYRRFGFVEMTVQQGRSPARPEPTPMFLPIRAIRRGKEGR